MAHPLDKHYRLQCKSCERGAKMTVFGVKRVNGVTVSWVCTQCNFNNEVSFGMSG